MLLGTTRRPTHSHGTRYSDENSVGNNMSFNACTANKKKHITHLLIHEVEDIAMGVAFEGCFLKAGQTETKDLQIIVLTHVGEDIAMEVAFIGCFSRLIKQTQQSYRL